MNEREFHDRHYESEARILEGALLQRVHARTARQFLRVTGVGRAQRVLSLGCGDGSIERRLAPHIGEIVGIDISPVAIERARAKSAGLRNLAFFVTDGDFRGQYDVVTAFAFLHHLDDTALRETLRAARRALRPGGLFYSSDPSSRRLVGRLRGLVAGAYERHHSPDERELDPRALADLVVDAGFAPPAIGYTDYFLGPLAWLAPSAPRWLGAPLEALDNFALGAPGLRRYASSFSLCASSTSSSPR